MEKKLQVFVSSTFIDLKDERQKAVEGILRAGHIPAGMELFQSENKAQWSIIEQWIEESDVLMLILGGKYGSVDSVSGKSYTHLEYEFALENNIPVFAVVLDEQYLANKHSRNINLGVYETENIEGYTSFKQKVTSNYVSFVNDINLIPYEVTLALQNFIKKDGREYHFKGWIRGTNVVEVPAPVQVIKNTKLIELDEALLSEITYDIEQLDLINLIDSIGTYCSYVSSDRQTIDDFVYKYTRPDKKFINVEANLILTSMLKQLDDYTSHLVSNFFPRYERLRLYPDLNVDLDGSGLPEEMEKYDKALRKLSNITTETLNEFSDFMRNSKIALYS